MKLSKLDALLAAIPIAASASAQSYSLTDIGASQGQVASRGVSINAGGRVAGYIFDSQDSEVFSDKGFQWTTSTGFQFLPFAPTGFPTNRPESINSAGEIAGYSYQTNSTRYGLDWSGSSVSALPGGAYSEAYGINDSATKTGGSGAGSPSERAVIWTSSGIQDIQGSAIGVGKGESINNAGAVSGIVNNQAFLWTSGTGLTVLDQGSYTLTEGAAINANNWVVGSGFLGGIQHALLWRPGFGVMDLGGGPGGAFATSINDNGQVIGFIGGYGQFLWNPTTGMENLQTALDSSGAGWTLYGVADINNSGQIVGYGQKSALNSVPHALLLNPIPVPEPATLFGLAMLIPVAVSGRRRRGR